MPTEWERSSTSPDLGITVDTNTTSALLESKDSIGMDKDMNGEMSTSTGSNSSTNASTNGHNGSSSNGGRKTSLTSPDPTAYVAKARVTRPTPPPPSYNPMQFVQIKPCNLYQTAQQQLKKAEEVKKIKEIQKEEPEEWQNNLDNWKSSRRKRVEHIIDRVVEVKKLELEEHDRSRRKSKTFSEMIEERGERGVRVGRAKLVSLAVYNEDESNDLSDLGIGTSSASGKSSVSEDYENNSVASDNADLEKAILDSNNHPQNSTTREYVSSPGYDTSSSTAPASSPDPCEYTYEGAIQDYKQRVSRATSGGSSGFKLHSNSNNQIKSSSATSKESTPEHTNIDTAPMEAYAARRGCKIEERLIGFEVSSPNDSQDLLEKNKVDLPKIDISKRKEIFECATSNNNINNEVTASNNEPKSHGSSGVPRVTLREHFKLEDAPPASSKKDVKRLSGDITSIKDRLQSLEQQNKLVNPVNSATKALSTKISDTPVPPLKDRLSSLKNAATKEEIKKPPVVLVDARQLQIMKDEEEHAKQRLLSKQMEVPTHTTDNTLEQLLVETKEIELDRDDSGIHTSDDIEEDHISEQKLLQQTQEQQFNEAIAALAIEEQQLEQAANAVNNIEAEFAQLSNASNQVNMVGATTTTTTTTTAATNEQPCEMEFSINEALELALEAIDKETNTAIFTKTKTTTTTTTASTISTTTIMNGDIDCNQNIIANATNSSCQCEERSATTTLDYDQLINDNKQLAEQAEDEKEQIKQKEQKIHNEPIYENISTTSTPVDAEAKIIPIHSKTTHHMENDKNQSNSNNIINSYNNKYVNTIHSSSSIANAQSLALSSSPEQHQLNTPRTSSPPLPPPPPAEEEEPYYQVPKSSEPYYDAPKHLRPIPLYENIEIFYNGLENATLVTSVGTVVQKMEPPKEKPPPPPTDSPPAFEDIDSVENGDNWSSDNTYETISNRLSNGLAAATTADGLHPSPPIKRMNSTKRIKKELRHKRSSFLGIEGSLDDDLEKYLELTVAPPPDMAQLLQEERRLEKQMYMKAGLCDSSDTGESRDSGVSENHSRQSSEPFTNSSEEMGCSDEPTLCLNTNANINANELIYQNEAQLLAAQTPLLQTVKGNSAESWTESATAAAAASKSLTEATATANAKMLSIEEKIREQEEVLRVERELLHLEQEELKRQRENLMLRENLARRELQHGAKMLMSANRRSLQDLNAGSAVSMPGFHQQPTSSTAAPALQVNAQQLQRQETQTQQIYANVPNLQQHYYQVDTDYRKSMSDLNEFSKRLMHSAPQDTPIPPSKPMRAMHVSTANGHDDFARQRYSLNAQNYGGSLVKIASSTAAPVTAHSQSAGALYSNYQLHQSAQNLAGSCSANSQIHANVPNGHLHTNMTRNTLHALSATPKPRYTDGWVQVQNRKSFDSNLSNDPAWLSAFQQKRKSVPDAYSYSNSKTNQWLMQEPEQQRLSSQQQSLSLSNASSPLHQQNGNLSKSKTGVLSSTGNGKPLPDSVIQTLTERLQSKGIGERKRFDNYNNSNNEKNLMHTASYQQHGYSSHQHQLLLPSHALSSNNVQRPPTLDLNVHNPIAAQTSTTAQDKVLSVSGKKKCSHCGDELGRGAAMIIESLLLFYHINCFKCCVCHVQLGDGLNGTDVRVRNHKLHCQNCYSSDDGIKFSCV